MMLYEFPALYNASICLVSFDVLVDNCKTIRSLLAFSKKHVGGRSFFITKKFTCLKKIKVLQNIAGS